MVGVVVVSHSLPLARAAAALAAEMVPEGSVPVEVAAGLGETVLGTDATAIASAVAAADRGDGVVVLMDLGSAVLSAEMALELLDDDRLRERVVLCPAPLVEGLVAAVVAAAGGAGRDEVAAEAEAGLSAKQSHLGPPAGVVPAADDGGRQATRSVTVHNDHGLHARPAARLVAEVRRFDATVELRNRTTGSAWVRASSLTRVATLGVLRGHEIEVRAEGPEAQEAVGQVVALAERGFDDPPAPSAAPAVPAAPVASSMVAGTRLRGQGAAAGVAVGEAAPLRAAVVEIPAESFQGADAEWERVVSALDVVRGETRRIRGDTARRDGEEQAAIFDAHLLLLDDAELLAGVRERIGDGQAAPRAWAGATGAVAAEFEALADPYLRGRATDVRAIADRVLAEILGVAGATTAAAGVIIAGDLGPAEAAGLDPELVAGVLTAAGSATSHAAILLRGRGIPAVAGLGDAVLAVAAGTRIALDGGSGEVVVAPSGEVLAGFRRRAAEQARRRERAAARAGEPAVSRDGVSVAVGANVGSVADARAAAAAGADLVGLVRTEFLFLDRAEAPGADEQESAYRDIAAAAGGRRVTLRTLDVGGDKPLPYLPAPAERNPFLGVRGLRHSLAHPGLLREQLRAIVRVARDVPVSVMFPMVSTVAEVIAARRLLDEAVAGAGGPRPAGLRIGIMVEVPAAALKAATFAPYVDFVSIGTNDLTQYALAAERGNAAVAALSDGLDPGVLRLVDAVCRGLGERVAVCGELATDEAAVPVLAGLGVRQLSVAPAAVPTVKEAVRRISLGEATATAAKALEAPDAAAVRALLG